jgi:DNA-directed RNA polymerase beta subunit
VVAQATNRRAASTAAEEIAQTASTLLADLDNAVFPHLGTKPGDRWVKLQYLSAVVRDMLRVHVSPAISATDRHHYSNKRLHGPGATLAKVFKTIANTTVVRPTLTALFAMLKTKDWVQITPDVISSTVQSELAGSALTKAMVDFMIMSERSSSSSSTMVVGRRPVLNRMPCNALERKNMLNMWAVIRGMIAKASSSNKSSESAISMRKVAPSANGYVCNIHSPDTGENVGMRRQLAITASITDAGDPQILISAPSSPGSRSTGSGWGARPSRTPWSGSTAPCAGRAPSTPSPRSASTPSTSTSQCGSTPVAWCAPSSSCATTTKAGNPLRSSASGPC